MTPPRSQPMNIDPELVAAVQQAIMRHPHYKDGPVTAFGYANVALKAADYATLKARISELESNERAYEAILGKRTYNEVAMHIQELEGALQPIVEVLALEWRFKGAHPHREAMLQHAIAALQAKAGS